MTKGLGERSLIRSRIENLEGITRKPKWSLDDIKIMVMGTKEEVDRQLAEEMENRKRLGIDKDPDVPDCIGVIFPGESKNKCSDIEET